MANDLQELQFKVLAQVIGAQSVEQLNNSLKGVESTAKKSKGSFDELAQAAKFLTAAFVAKEIFSFTKGIFDAADELNKLSQKTGISVDELSRFKVAAELADVPMDKLVVGFKKLAVAQVDASTGNSSLSTTFRRLGVDFVDSQGKLRKTGDVLKDLADAFQKTSDGPQKAADAVKIFGKAGTDMIPFLNQGSKGISEFGLAIDSAFAAGSEEFLDNLKKMKVNMENVVTAGLKELLPSLLQITKALVELPSDGEDTKTFFQDLAVIMKGLAVAGVVVTESLAAGFETLHTVAENSVDGLTRFMAMAVEKFAIHKRIISADTKEELHRAVKDLQGFEAHWKEIDDEANLTQEQRTARLAKSLEDRVKNTFNVIEKLSKAPDPLAKKDEKKGGKPDVPPAENNEIKVFNEKIAKINAEAKSLGISNIAKEKAVFLAEVEAKEIEKGSAAYKKLAVSVEQALKAREIAKETQAIKEYNISQQKELDLKRLETQQLNYTNAEYAKLVEVQKTENQISEATKNYTKEGTAAYREAAQAILDQKLALMDLQEEQKASYGYGAQQAIKDYTEMAKDNAAQMKKVFADAFNSLEDTLVDFIKTGKLNFRNFADSVINDLLRIAVRKAFIAPLADGLGSLFGGGGGAAAGATASASANGNIIGPNGPLPLSKFANGGVVSSPHVALFGEGSTPEAFVPLPDGRKIPVSLKGSKDSGGVNVVVNVNMTTGEQSSQGDSDSAKQFGNTISLLIQKEIVAQKRPGGLLSV